MYIAFVNLRMIVWNRRQRKNCVRLHVVPLVLSKYQYAVTSSSLQTSRPWTLIYYVKLPNRLCFNLNYKIKNHKPIVGINFEAFPCAEGQINCCRKKYWPRLTMAGRLIAGDDEERQGLETPLPRLTSCIVIRRLVLHFAILSP